MWPPPLFITCFIAFLFFQPAVSARAVTGRRYPFSGVGKDFLVRRLGPLTKTGITRERKVEQSIRRCQIEDIVEGYKRDIDEIRGPIRIPRECALCLLNDRLCYTWRRELSANSSTNMEGLGRLKLRLIAIMMAKGGGSDDVLLLMMMLILYLWIIR